MVLSKLLFFCLASLLYVCLSCRAASAQIATFIKTDVGGASSSSTYSYSSGTYTVTAYGNGLGSTTDSVTFPNTPVTGNIEIIARVTSQSSTHTLSPYAIGGIMLRSSADANAQQACVTVSPSNGVNFTARTVDGGTNTTTLGPSIAAPIWLRLVVSGTSVAGYQSSDCRNWVLVGKTTMTLPTVYYAGFVCSNSLGGTTDECTIAVTPAYILTNVPQRSPNMLCWLRADAGLATDASGVRSWSDQSASGMNASNTTGANQPTLTTLNGLPCLNFSSAAHQFLNLASGFADFSAGYTSFTVINNPTTPQGDNNRIINLNSGGGSDNGIIVLSRSTTTAALAVLTASGSSGTYLTTPDSAGTHVLAFTQLGTIGQAWTDGSTGGTNPSMIAMGVSPRTANLIGKYSGDSSHDFNGQLAEAIIFDTQLNDTQIQAIQLYSMAKWGIPYTLPAPTFSSGPFKVAASTQQVTISVAPGAVALYTVDGSTPVPGGATTIVYTPGIPITVSSTATIKAIAICPGLTTSPVSAATIQIDSTAAAILLPSLQLWLRADLGAVTSGSNVTYWSDVSGNNNSGTPSASAPTLVPDAINGLPAISFNGTSQYFSLPASSAYSSGVSIFVVAQPTGTVTAGKRFVDFGNGSTTNSFTLREEATNGLGFYNYNGSSGASVTQPNVFDGNYKVLSAVFDGATNAGIFANSVRLNTNSSMNAMVATMRSTNSVGRYGGNSLFFGGNIAEVLVYSAPLTDSQRMAVENMLATRYGLYINPPVITPGTGVYSAPQTVTISAAPGSVTRYTTDGTAVTPTSPIYSAPFTVSGWQTIRARSYIGAGSSTEARVDIAADSGTTAVPRTGLLGWYMSNLGFTGGSPGGWSDLSGNRNDATNSQPPSYNAPYLVSNAINGFPAISTNYPVPPGLPAFMTLPAGYANLTSGISIFAVANAPGSIVSLTTGSTTNSVYFNRTSPLNLTVYKSTTNNTLSAATVGSGWQVYSGTQSGSTATGTLLQSGQVIGSGALPSPNNVTRSSNTMISCNCTGPGDTFAEVLIYGRGLSLTEQFAVHSYLLRKYAIGGPVQAPTFSVAGGTTFTRPTQVAISGPYNATLYATVDGTTPTTASPQVTGPIDIYHSLTLKAIAVVNGVTSPVATATYTLDSTKFPAPIPGDPAPRINIQVPTPAQ